MKDEKSHIINIKFDDNESVISLEFEDIYGNDQSKMDRELLNFLLSKANEQGEALFDTSVYKGMELAPEEIISFEFLKHIIDNKK